jgi:hypothetical protein
MGAPAETAPEHGASDPHLDMLHAEGYAIVRGAADRGFVASIAETLAPTFAATPFCTGDFYGWRTKRFGRLLIRSARVHDLVMNRRILDLVEASLGAWCDTIQLNLVQAIEIHQGAPAQFPHRDQAMWGGEIGRLEYLVNVMWPLTPFTRDNGATIIWPGSHGQAALSDAPPDRDAIDALASPGDAIVFLGSTLHGAGTNRTPVPRQAIVVSYCLGWLKPYENAWLAYPPDVARHFSPALAGLVGYRQHRPNLGNIEGQCPSVLLRGPIDGPVGAIDALTPEQDAELSAFVARQTFAVSAP